jgi:hypothetical protein
MEIRSICMVRAFCYLQGGVRLAVSCLELGISAAWGNPGLGFLTRAKTWFTRICGS